MMDDIDITALQKRVFRKNPKTKELSIGAFPIRPEIRTLLREQASGFLLSELYEIMHATLLNESARLALQSTSMEHVQFAKALKYWDRVMEDLLITLAKKNVV